MDSSNLSDSEKFALARERLKTVGLDMVAVFDPAELPQPIVEPLLLAIDQGRPFQRVVLFGHSGRKFWEALSSEGKSLFETSEPVDRFSRQSIEAVLEQSWKGMAVQFLYPGRHIIPLQQLGRLAGWHHDSPLGIGIKDGVGLWFAYRALVLIDAPIPVSQPESYSSPCDRCVESQCVSTCPADALSRDQAIDLQSCAGFRLQEASVCSDRCIARESCNVGLEYRYCREQIQYHYCHSLLTLKEYYSS